MTVKPMDDGALLVLHERVAPPSQLAPLMHLPAPGRAGAAGQTRKGFVVEDMNGEHDPRTPALWISGGTGRDGRARKGAPKVGWCWWRNNRLAFSLGHELKAHGATAVAVSPGWMRSELMLEAFGVTEETSESSVAITCAGWPRASATTR